MNNSHYSNTINPLPDIHLRQQDGRYGATNKAPTKIQSLFRGYLVRHRLKKEAAAIKIQAVSRGYLDRQEFKLIKANPERAKILKNQEDCPISHEHLTMSKSSVIGCCGRVFKTESLLQWATINNPKTCPNCRSEITIDDLLQDQLNIKNFKSALQIADTITNEKIKSLALLDISQFYLKNGNHEEALKIAASIPLKDTKRDALNEIWNFLVKDGNTKKIVDLLTITLPTMDNDSAKTDLILGVKYRLSDEQFMGLINMTFPTLNNDSAKIKLILGVKDKLSSDQLFELIANFIKKGRGLGLEDKLHDLFFDVKDSLSPTHLINFIEMTIIINYAPINEGHYKNQIIVAVKDKISNDQLFKLMKMTIPTLYKQKSMYMVSMFYWVKGKLSNDQIIDLIINNKRDCTGDDIIACIKQTHTPMNVQQKKTLIEGVKDKLSEEEITLINNLQK